MVNYRKILELHFEEVSQRTISSSTGHSRNTVSDVVQRAKETGCRKLERHHDQSMARSVSLPRETGCRERVLPG